MLVESRKSRGDLALDDLCVNTIRTLAIDAIQQAKSGHPGLPLGAAPMAYVLWTRAMRHNPANPTWPDRDRFAFSAGHGSMLLYSLLYLAGYDLTLDDLKTFRQYDSRTPGHPEYGPTPGVEMTTGPLGQGFAMGVGMAVAEAHLAATYNRPGHAIVDHCTYGLCSDGDLMEGISHEAAGLAGSLGLGKLIYLYDQNQVSLAGSTALAFREDVARRFEAYGWQVLQVEDGNDRVAIEAALREARAETQRPTLVAVRTVIGYGSPHKAGTFEAHGAPLGEDEVRLTKLALGWPWPEETFHVPNEALAHLRWCRERGAQLQTEWEQRFKAYRLAFPDRAAEFERTQAGRLPAGWDQGLPRFDPAAERELATRQAGGRVLTALASRLPELIGGSADLNPSTNTALKDLGDFQSEQALPEAGPVQGAVGGEWGYAGRNLHFGVREHAMGAIANGIALHGGLIPFGATFLTFSDYQRPAIRLAALSKIGSIFVFTHDSIGVGEDGPTHQPVEHLAALRAVPGLVVIRPADANESAEAWKVAVARRHGPTVLAFTRQAVPVLDRTTLAPASGLARGAYVLADAPEGDPALILIATGSEVALALQARDELLRRGVATRVVSMPSWELFDQQPEPYREQVLPARVAARLAIEAGVSMGWHRYVGSAGDVLGLDRFGASAPGKVVFERFGFTVRNVVERALKLVGQ
ncbi:MAG: transketolase [Chloroflexi bacterium]|nr:transketolase [Chloroflexota bacterium]